MPTKLEMEPMRDAHSNKDGAASREAHETAQKAEEKHSDVGEHVKPIVFGGMDGIITTFAVVAGAAGGGLGTGVVLILGFASIFADALSMGMGEAMSGVAEIQNMKHEREREMWELTHDPDGERREMVELYVEKGVEQKDAEEMIAIMSKPQYKEFFVDVMMAEELGMIIDPDDSPWQEGLYCGLSFVFFGTWPLIGYVLFSGVIKDLDVLFALACIITCVMLFNLGVAKSFFSVKHWVSSGLETLGIGGLTAVVAYLIGWIVALIVGEESGSTAGLV